MSKKRVVATAAALFLAAAGGAFDPTSAAGPVWPQGSGGGHPQFTPHGFGGGTPRFQSFGGGAPRFAHFNLDRSAVPFSGFNRFALSRPFGARYFWRHPFGGYAFGPRFGSLQVGRQFMGAYAPRYAAVGRFAPGATTQFGQIGKYHHGWYAWRRFQRGFVGWAGPVFWPYAYDDLFDYAFWPYDYETDNDLFWAYGYDDLFAGILLPYDYAGLESDYGPAQPPAAASAPQPGVAAAAPSAAQLCVSAQSIAGGVAIDEIAKALQPTAGESAKLDALKAAEAEAEKTLAASCAAQAPTTALARLDATRTRLQAMIQATDAVGPSLRDFYASLTDEQKAAFNALGEGRQTPPAGLNEPNFAQLCGPQNAIPFVAIDRIDKAVQPDAKQRQLLVALRDAAGKADDAIVATCPTRAPLTPPGRLAAMRARLQAMLSGVDMVRLALQDFYASLSDAQKARFDALTLPPAPGRQAATTPPQRQAATAQP